MVITGAIAKLKAAVSGVTLLLVRLVIVNFYLCFNLSFILLKANIGKKRKLKSLLILLSVAIYSLFGHSFFS